MSDDTGGIPLNKRTVEIYRDLLQVEVRALVTRVSELTHTVGSLFGEVNLIAIQLEESIKHMERLSGRLVYCEEELSTIKKNLADYEKMVDDIHELVLNTENIMEALQKHISNSE